MSEDTRKLSLRKNGDLTITEDGQKTVVAHYDRETGRLEFTTKKYSEEFYNQATACIGTVSGGKEVSSLVIRSIGVKGDNWTPPKNVPKKPKLGVEGDAAEDVVQWYLTYDLPQAIIRYGIYTDAKGDIIRKPVRRVIKSLMDSRNLDDDNIEQVKDGNKSWTKSPVATVADLIEKEDGIIARRATRLTFTPAEVVGGFQPDDDYEEPIVKEDES